MHGGVLAACQRVEQVSGIESATLRLLRHHPYRIDEIVHDRSEAAGRDRQLCVVQLSPEGAQGGVQRQAPILLAQGQVCSSMVPVVPQQRLPGPLPDHAELLGILRATDLAAPGQPGTGPPRQRVRLSL